MGLTKEVEERLRLQALGESLVIVRLEAVGENFPVVKLKASGEYGAKGDRRRVLDCQFPILCRNFKTKIPGFQRLSAVKSLNKAKE